MGVGVVADEGFVVEGIELAKLGVALGDIDGLALRIEAIKLQEGGRLGALVDLAPPYCWDAFELATDKHALRMGVVLALVIRQATQDGML